MTVTFASQDGIGSMDEQINALLEILGHPEAFVTDESSFADFIWAPGMTKEERQLQLDGMLTKHGIQTKIGIFDLLVEGVQKILGDNPSWPNQPTIQ